MPVVNPNAANQKDDRFLQINSAADKSQGPSKVGAPTGLQAVE